ncbi:hypothetical protein CFC21_014675 [Triticum aestivum]|uniref:Uncharacterized protein n=2 Tax=Triticum aestivum TaxID=4565 RepID=A0A3B6APT5_WHEAT|nr:hypothetical protein CFC21_014675 [Triticum aestivum]
MAVASTLVAVVASVALSSTQGGPDRPAAGTINDAAVGRLERLADLGASFSGARIPYSPAALASTPAATAAPTRARSWRSTSRGAACMMMLQATGSFVGHLSSLSSVGSIVEIVNVQSNYIVHFFTWQFLLCSLVCKLWKMNALGFLHTMAF